AAAIAAVHRLHRTAVQLDQMLDDREAEPAAAVRARTRRIGLAEAVEHVREELGRYARTVVANRDLHGVLRRFDAESDVTAFGRELDRVVENIPGDLLQSSGVAGERDGAAAELGGDLHALGLRRGAQRVERRVDHRFEIDRFELQAELAGEYTRD